MSEDDPWFQSMTPGGDGHLGTSPDKIWREKRLSLVLFEYTQIPIHSGGACQYSLMSSGLSAPLLRSIILINQSQRF